MLSSFLEKVLIIDGKEQHLDNDNAIVIHPKKLNLANMFEKNSFNKAIIRNSTVDDLKALSFFNIAQALKTGGTLEIIVCQPITVLQGVDADELEAKAKLGGFRDIKREPYETWIREGDQDYQLKTIKMIMIKENK